MKTCKNCGKKAHKITKRIYNLGGEYDHLFDEDFKYLGNDILLSTEIRSKGDGDKVIRFSTWTGSYKLAYDNFCTLRCANAWANNMINGGYIRVQPMVRDWNWR